MSDLCIHVVLSCACKTVVELCLTSLILNCVLSELCLSCACKTVVDTALADADLLTESSCCSRSCHRSSCSSQCCCCHSPSMLANKVEVEAGFPDVPVELVVLTLLATITGDGAVPHLVEEVGNVELYLSMYTSYSLLLSKWSLHSISFSMLLS